MKDGWGFTGKILRVDLTERRSWTESMEEYAKRFIGGIGLGYKIFWDDVGAEVGAYDPENRLVFAPGPLTGTLAPGSGRFEIVSKSPRSYPKETVTRSGMGGFWGPELKYAGYDALVVQGKSDEWVNLWISNDGVEFLSAKDYLGEDTFSTQIRLRKELDTRCQILCIGPAGERLSRLAVILSEMTFASGRSGFGAVMGAKRLKAIAVRGTNPLGVFDPQRLIEVSKKVRALSNQNTSRERTTLILNLKEREEFINKHRKKNTGCFGCPLLCFTHIDVPGVDACAAHCISYFYHPHATKFYGATLERDQAVAEAYSLANRYGLDTFEFWHMINFLRDLRDAGLLNQLGLDLDNIGRRGFVQKLLESITYRKGFGDLLAEGCARTADHIKNGWEFCAKYFPAYGSAAHGPIRKSPALALLWALDSRGPLVDQHSYIRLSISFPNETPPLTLPRERAESIAQRFLGSKLAIDHSTFESKAEAVIQTQDHSAVIDILVLCDWLFPCFHSFATEDRLGDLSLESQLLSAVTGHPWSEKELNRAGERVWNLARAIMIREGRTREQDTIHGIFFREDKGEKAVFQTALEQAKTEYYRLRGWDERSGWPTREKLEDLALFDVANDLKKEALLT
jgi:aldehyde:ferredoxin oxidoreductase